MQKTRKAGKEQLILLTSSKPNIDHRGSAELLGIYQKTDLNVTTVA